MISRGGKEMATKRNIPGSGTTPNKPMPTANKKRADNSGSINVGGIPVRNPLAGHVLIANANLIGDVINIQGGSPIMSNAQVPIMSVRAPEMVVTFDANGGALSGNVKNPRRVWPGEAVGDLPIPARPDSGYIFTGWKVGATIINRHTIIWHDMIVVASWMRFS